MPNKMARKMRVQEIRNHYSHLNNAKSEVARYVGSTKPMHIKQKTKVNRARQMALQEAKKRPASAAVRVR